MAWAGPGPTSERSTAPASAACCPPGAQAFTCGSVVTLVPRADCCPSVRTAVHSFTHPQVSWNLRGGDAAATSKISGLVLQKFIYQRRETINKEIRIYSDMRKVTSQVFLVPGIKLFPQLVYVFDTRNGTRVLLLARQEPNHSAKFPAQNQVFLKCFSSLRNIYEELS